MYGCLKDMKTEIEHVQHLLEKAKVQLQKDFDVWWKHQANQVRIIPPHTVASSISRRIYRGRNPPSHFSIVFPTPDAYIYKTDFTIIVCTSPFQLLAAVSTLHFIYLPLKKVASANFV